MDRRTFLELLTSVPLASTPLPVPVADQPARLVYAHGNTGPGAGVWIDGIETRATRFSATYEQHYVDTMQEGWPRVVRRPGLRYLYFHSEVYAHDAERDGPVVMALLTAFTCQTPVRLVARTRMGETMADASVHISSLSCIEDAREAGVIQFHALG